MTLRLITEYVSFLYPVAVISTASEIGTKKYEPRRVLPNFR
jgi:hypothetical protein